MEANPFENTKKEISVGDKTYSYYSLKELNDDRICKFDQYFSDKDKTERVWKDNLIWVDVISVLKF